MRAAWLCLWVTAGGAAASKALAAWCATLREEPPRQPCWSAAELKRRSRAGKAATLEEKLRLGASSESVSPSSAKNEVELDELDAAAPMASTLCRAASTPSTRPSESLPASGTVSRLRRSTQVINSEQKINLNLTPGSVFVRPQ